MMFDMKKSMLLAIIFIIPFCVLAQGSAGSGAYYETRYIIDMPTAGVMPRGTFSIYSVAFTGGGILAEINAAPFEDFNMGISYSGTNIIGEGPVEFQNIPGVHLKYRIIGETSSFPAIVAGVSIQGSGGYNKIEERYRTLSPGAYCAISKEFLWALGKISLHGGINYSFEAAADDKAPNFYIGFEQGLGKTVSFNMEYNANSDDKNNAVLEDQGLLNASIRLSLSNGFTVGFQARDLLENYAGSRGFTRCMTLEYVNSF